jgi:hypothetical protein
MNINIPCRSGPNEIKADAAATILCISSTQNLLLQTRRCVFLSRRVENSVWR